MDNVASSIINVVKNKADDLVKWVKKITKLDGAYEFVTPDGVIVRLKNQEISNISKVDEAASSIEREARKRVGRLDLAGKPHPVSGVMFDAEGFPLFKSLFDMHLDPSDYMKSRNTHYSKASKQLYLDILYNPDLAKKFTNAEIQMFKAGDVPINFTWHHHQDSGRMQLVNRTVHNQTGHSGGFSIWGPGN